MMRLIGRRTVATSAIPIAALHWCESASELASWRSKAGTESEPRSLLSYRL